MTPKKFRWSKVYESSEEELLHMLESRKLSFTNWKLEQGEERHRQQIDKKVTLWCAEGSFIITVDGNTISMQPGDALEVPAGSTYEVGAGISGCTCYET